MQNCWCAVKHDRNKSNTGAGYRFTTLDCLPMNLWPVQNQPSWWWLSSLEYLSCIMIWLSSNRSTAYVGLNEFYLSSICKTFEWCFIINFMIKLRFSRMKFIVICLWSWLFCWCDRVCIIDSLSYNDDSCLEIIITIIIIMVTTGNILPTCYSPVLCLLY